MIAEGRVRPAHSKFHRRFEARGERPSPRKREAASERDVEAIRGIFAFSRADESSIEALDFCDPEIEIQDYPGFIDAEWHRGHEGVRRWAAKIWEVIRVGVKPTEFIGADDGRLVVSYDIVDLDNQLKGFAYGCGGSALGGRYRPLRIR